ncbi:two-component system, chemotaxis family, response regulator CheB [Andreprevotia lacus DSM 23236]|jgi:two-component system chemotaxis response regulator CheB|uniref:protein-glutamate methylesterase n=1 Tax=Andreprevotia lacus DSM 23236 TaxID=1121001 RepID=A0A1W1XAJ5_9NEIS|nr:chemotaxis protein CheB [Andreprevotia lacus]SMC20541.1 two-component system, chemotaxis family, response regulator CheB [Andreprevotia lacus DSM 23236]
MALELLPNHSADAVLPLRLAPHARTSPVVLIGASTGGTEALKVLLLALPANAPPVLVTQHMPPTFTKAFAERLDHQCQVTVKEAEQGDLLLPGHVYIAPGHSHLLLSMHGGRYGCELSQAPAVNRHRPAVDVLFRSAANVAGANAIGIILTGMGRDGAQGMREMRNAGAYNFAQDEATCVVFGMPREAIAMGGVNEVCALQEIAPRMLARAARGGAAAP